MSLSWNKPLSELEQNAVANFVDDKDNNCEIIDEVYEYGYMGGSIEHTLYRHSITNDYVFVVRQKGNVANVVRIPQAEIKEFMDYWKSGKLTPLGRIDKSKKTTRR